MFYSDIEINGRYLVKEKIADGGMGQVWKCKDIVLNRYVAIKTVNSDYIAENSNALSVLKYEAKTGARLIGHPNLVTILDFGIYESQNTSTYFIVMEFVEGITLSKWIKSIASELDEMTSYSINLYIAWELCKAIGYAHRIGVLLRDIKPKNTFISNFGIIKVGDYGIAKFMSESTRTNTVDDIKTAAYAAPEQWKGRKHTKKTDLYQLGCTLYRLFTKKLPFECDTIALYDAHMYQTPVSPSELSSVVSKKLSDAILKTLRKKPDKRGTLWELNDIIAAELQRTYEIELDVHNESEEILNLVYEITEFDVDNLAHGPFITSLPDFSETLSESIQLILSGIKNIKIR